MIILAIAAIQEFEVYILYKPLNFLFHTVPKLPNYLNKYI